MGKITTELLIKMIESKRPVEYENQLLPFELNVWKSSRARSFDYAM
jgi:hypothetical protein